MKLSLLHILLTSVLLSIAALAHSDTGDSKSCFEKKDKVCLEKISKALHNDSNSAEFDGVYFLGLLHLEDKEYEAAKQQFKLGAAFGDKERNVEKMMELFNSVNVNFTLDDCNIIRMGITIDMGLYSPSAEECYLDVAEKKPKKAKTAYYSIAAMFKDANPEHSEEYLIKAAELKHKPSACLLEVAYTEFKADERKPLVAFILDIKKDQVKAEYWGKKCPF